MPAPRYNSATRTGIVDAIKTAHGTSPEVRLLASGGSPPANLTDADAGTLCASMTLPNPHMAATSNGVSAKTGTWEDATPAANGAPDYYRIYQGGVCVEQGTVTAIGGGGVMEIDDINVVTTTPVSVTAYTITAGNS